MIIKSVLFAIFLAVVSNSTVLADEFDDGLAAQQGDASAQYNQGLKYYSGKGVPQNYARAEKLFRLAAKQGDASAQTLLGVMYAKGQGVPQKYAEAAKWYRLAAKQGEVSAQYNLGIMYAQGQGVPQDNVKAHLWFNLAAIAGDEDSISNRDITATKMSPQQIAKAQQMAENCIDKNLKDCD